MNEIEQLREEIYITQRNVSELMEKISVILPETKEPEVQFTGIFDVSDDELVKYGARKI